MHERVAQSTYHEICCSLTHEPLFESMRSIPDPELRRLNLWSSLNSATQKSTECKQSFILLVACLWSTGTLLILKFWTSTSPKPCVLNLRKLNHEAITSNPKPLKAEILNPEA